MTNTESFTLDHTIVLAPYIRHCGTVEVMDGKVQKYDVRFKQPNKESMSEKGLHSLEHLMAEYIRNHAKGYEVIDISPMGCQTGFYLAIAGEPTTEEVIRLINRTLTDVLAAKEVPASNVTQCGQASLHSLSEAKMEAMLFSMYDDEYLLDVYGNGK